MDIANKFLSILCVTLISICIENDLNFVSLVMGPSLAHFWIAHFYEWKFFRKRWDDFKERLRLYFGLFGSIIIVALYQPLLNVTIFGLHFALSDSYMGIKQSENKSHKSIVIARAAYELLLVLVIFLRGFIVLPHIKETLVFFSLATCAYGCFLFSKRKSISNYLLANIVGLHFATMAVIALQYLLLKMSDFRAVFFVILIHGFYWLYNPLFRTKFKPLRYDIIQFAIVFIASFILAAITNWLIFTFSWGYEITRVVFLVWFYFHMFTHLQIIRIKQLK